MTEQELTKQIDQIIENYDKDPTRFKYQQRAEDQLAKLITKDTKPEDVDALVHLIKNYPSFDNVMVNIGDDETLCVKFFLSYDIMKNNEQAKKEFIKMIIGMSRGGK